MEHFTGPQVSMKPSQKSPTLAASAQSINRFLLEKVTRTKTKKGKKKEIKHLMIESIPLSPFFIYPSAHPPNAPPPTPRIHNIHKRLFRSNLLT